MKYMTFNQACASIGYNPTDTCPIDINVVYRAYKDGKSEVFPTRMEAEKFSKLIERVTTNQVEWDKYWEERQKLEQAATSIWYEHLKAYWAQDCVTDKFFDVCYSEAYDRGHSSGHDEVASYMHSVVEFARKIQAIARKAV